MASVGEFQLPVRMSSQLPSGLRHRGGMDCLTAWGWEGERRLYIFGNSNPRLSMRPWNQSVGRGIQSNALSNAPVLA